MAVSLVHKLLRGRLATYPLTHPIAWEGVAFTPTNVPFVAANLLPFESVANTIGEGGLYRAEGLFQVTAYTPFGDGSGAAETIADAILEHFPRALNLTGDGVTVTIVKSWRGPAMTDGVWYKIPASIRYFANLAADPLT